MKNDIQCAACQFMQVKPEKFSKRLNGRKKRFCTHSDAKIASKAICEKSETEPDFISYTKDDGGEADIKTAPRWCPLKLMESPRKISKKAAYRIIDAQMPRGLFYLVEGDNYVGIDNRTGDVWVEEFQTLQQCRKWLVKEREEL